MQETYKCIRCNYVGQVRHLLVWTRCKVCGSLELLPVEAWSTPAITSQTDTSSKNVLQLVPRKPKLTVIKGDKP